MGDNMELEVKRKQNISFLKGLVFNSKENFTKNSYNPQFWKSNPYVLNVQKLPFKHEEIEESCIQLFKEEKVFLKELVQIGIPSFMVDYVSARRWFTGKEIDYISKMPDDYFKALTIIGRIYAEKTDRSGYPQSKHLISVSNALDTKEEKTVGLLHDVVEDGYLTLMSLTSIFQFKVREVRAVDVLTRDKEIHSTYDSYIRNQILVSKSLVVLKTKLKDMLHNQSVERVIYLPTEEERHKALTKYKPYIPLVEECIEEVKLERKRRL